MTFQPRLALFRLLVYLAFFASGAACLIAEVTWNRMLIVVVGNSLGATALIVAIFMGGLGAGSYAAGRWIAKRTPSLLPYVLLEVAVGLYVLASPALFDALSGMFTSLADTGGDRGYLTFARVVVTMAALFVPAFLMGATFPAIVSATAHHARSESARTGYLYSINTLGAAIGCFVAGYHLLFELGVRTTLKVAFTLYVVAAASGLIARLLSTEFSVQYGRGEGRAPRSAAAPLRRFLYVATFLVGFVALAYEVLLTRMGILYLGNSISVFALVLTGFLLGTGISAVAGTWLYGALRRATPAADKMFGAIAIAAGLLVVATPYFLLLDWLTSPDELARFADAAPRNPFSVLAIIVAPTVLIGALLPIAIRMINPEGRGDNTRKASTLYALNTAGALLGAGTANHLLVPAIGVQGVLALLAAMCIGVGLFNLLSSRRRAAVWQWGAVAAGVAVVLVVAVAALPSLTRLYGQRVAESTRARSAEVKLIVEGRAATVAVVDQDDPERGSYRDMYLNGVEEASTRYWHTQLFKLLGILPVLVHESEEPKQVLVIAFGAGITAGSTLASSEVASLDVVDLNPDIGGINDLFTEVNGDVFHEPRFHFYNDDGRNYLVTSGKQYDVIVNDSTHPRAYDSWILYTEEFYRAVAHRLKPGGVFAQWVPVLGSMQGELFSIHLNTFRRVFPNATFWYVYGSDQAFLLATPEPLDLDRDRLQEELDRLPAWFRAGEYQLDTVARLAGFFWMDERAMARMIGDEQRVNTDDLHYFDKQSAVVPAPPAQRLPAFQASALPYLGDPEGTLATAVQKEQAVARRLAHYAFFASTADLLAAFCLMPDNGNVRYWMDRTFAGEPPDDVLYCNEELQSYRALAEQHPDNTDALNGLAFLLAEAGQLEEAVGIAARAASLAPRDPMVLDTYGWILFRQQKLGPAMAALEQARQLTPDDPVVLYHLGAVCKAAGQDERAQQLAARALSLSSDFPGVDGARSLIANEDPRP